MSETPSTNYSMTQPHTSESEQSLSPRPLNVTDPVVAKRICFYKSGDPQFNGVKMVVNSRSFKSFDALLDNLSKRVPLPFGVRTITTPRGIHGITNLEDLEDGKSYICSQQKKIKPINLEKASKKPLPWQISRPVSARRKAVQLAREGEDGVFHRGGNIRISTPKKLLVFKNGDVRVRRTIVLGKKNTQNFEAFLDNISELMQYPVVKLYTTDGRKVPNLQALILCSGAVVAAGREPFRPGNYDPHRYSLPGRLPGISNRVYPKTNAKSEGRKNSSSRSQIFSTSSYKGYSNDNDSASSYALDNDNGLAENHSHGGEDLPVVPSEDDIEKSVHLNQDGSMTVEMRVRFKIKEDETIKWTTTVSRAGFSTDRNAKIGTSAVVAEDQTSELNILTCKNIVEDSNSAEEDAADQQTSREVNNKGLETCSYDIWQNPSVNIESDNDMVKPHFYRPPTPGPRRVRKKKALVESVTTVSDTAVQKQMVGQFSYSEETDTGETKSEYCLVTHSSNKTSNVNKVKLSKTPSNEVPKQSSEDKVEEEILNKVYHQTTTERSIDLPDEDSLSQNIMDKTAIKEESHNCITSDCGPDTSHVESSLRNYHASEEVLANQSGKMEREQNHSEWSQSKSEEMIWSEQDRLSHSSSHPSPDEINQAVCQCAKITMTVTESSITANNSSMECITTHFSDESQVVSAISKKKKKKKKRKSSSDIRDQGGHCQHRLHDIPMEGTIENGIKVCEMPITKDTTSNPASQISVHERGLEFLAHNTNGSYKSLDAEEDLYSQVSINHQQNESDLRQNLDSQLSKVRLEKCNVLPSQDLLLGKDYSKNETEHISEGSHDSTNIEIQTPFGMAALNETECSCKEEKEKGKSFKRSTKHKKVKKNKKLECSPRSQAKLADDSCTMDPFRNANETVENSLESYVQSWLQNIFPWAVTSANNLDPINSNERIMHPLSDTSFSDKENQLEIKNVYLMGKNNISESKLSNSTLNHLNEIGIVQESIKDFHEKHFGYALDASIIDDTKSGIHYSAKQSMCDIVHANDTNNPLESDSQYLSDDRRCSSEIAIQADPKAIDSVLGTNVQTDCVTSLLLNQLKSAVLNFEKSHIGCIEKSCCLTDISPSLFGSSSDLLLAWLLVQNFKDGLSSMNNDDIGQTACNFSEIVTLQQYLKQIIAKEETKNLGNDVSNLQECTENHLVFSGMQKEMREPTYCQENIIPVDTENTSAFEAQGKLSKTFNSNDWLDSEDITDANKFTEDTENSNKSQENCSTLTDNPSLDNLDDHYVLQDLNCDTLTDNPSLDNLDDHYVLQDLNCDTLTDNPSLDNLDAHYVLQDLNCDNAHQVSNCELKSNEELPKDNEDISVQESLDRNTDTPFNNEESGLSEEPKSTTYSLTSNDKDHIFDLETSELEEKDFMSLEEQECTESPEKEETSSDHVSLTAKNAAESGSKDSSVQKCLEESGACEEPCEQLSAPSLSSFCHEPKQTPVDVSAEEPISRVKLMVKELECGSYSNSPSVFKRCFKNSVASDLSDYPPDSERSDYSCMPSSDLTNESTEERIYEKEYNTGFVKRTIEKLYGKAEVPFKPLPKLGLPYGSQIIARHTEESFHPVVEKAPSLGQVSHSSDEDEELALLTSDEIPEVNKSSNIWVEENIMWPAPQFSLGEEDACYNEECSMQYSNQCCQSEAHTAEDEGVLIDKGKWLLKENHLIRRSPPETLGMYGNIETTSAETMVDTHSDDISYSHVGNLDLQPPLKEISSSEIEDMTKPFDEGCNYFNMPHNSESEPFPDELSIKSKHSQYGSTLSADATRKEWTTPTQPCKEINTNSPSFRSMEFRLPDNKVHPLEQPSHEKAHLTQPTRNTPSNRIRHEDQDSLDKLHAICGQHCPILMAIVNSANEEVRGCVYRKASDIENQLGLYFLMNTLNLRWQGKDLNKLDNKHVNLKNSCINTMTNNILNRFYSENTLEFISENNLGLLISPVQKENKSLNKLYARENMDIDAEEHHENYATQEAFREVTIDPCHNASVFQSLRSNVNHVVGAESASAPADIMEGCESETFYSYETFLNNVDQNANVNLEDANIVDVTEEIHSYVSEEESNNNNSNS